jgi:hypothetical protein
MGYGFVSSGCWIFFQDIGSFYIPDDLLAKFDNTKKTLGAQQENSHFYHSRVVEIRQEHICFESRTSKIVVFVKSENIRLSSKICLRRLICFT